MFLTLTLMCGVLLSGALWPGSMSGLMAACVTILRLSAVRDIIVIVIVSASAPDSCHDPLGLGKSRRGEPETVTSTNRQAHSNKYHKQPGHDETRREVAWTNFTLFYIFLNLLHFSNTFSYFSKFSHGYSPSYAGSPGPLYLCRGLLTASLP